MARKSKAKQDRAYSSDSKATLGQIALNGDGTKLAVAGALPTRLIQI